MFLACREAAWHIHKSPGLISRADGMPSRSVSGCGGSVEDNTEHSYPDGCSEEAGLVFTPSQVACQDF